MRTLIPNRSVVIGFLTGMMTLAAVAWFCGPKVTRHEEDPLTGRIRHTTEWLGATFYSRVEETEVSRWANPNSLKAIYPGQYGWSIVSSTHRNWFGSTWIACGGGYAIPLWIFRGDIKLDGFSREELLRKYQTELVENWKQNGSLLPTVKDWSRSIQVTNTESP
jgi:hypothetical protein